MPIEVFDGIRKGTFDNRSQFYKDLVVPFYGYNRAGAMGGLKGQAKKQSDGGIDCRLGDQSFWYMPPKPAHDSEALASVHGSTPSE